MTFYQLKALAEELKDIIKIRLGSTYIDDITVEEPQPPEDELHFIRLVNWGYVFFNEAGQPLLREIFRLLKVSNPKAAQHFNEYKEDLNSLRTHANHNLPKEKSNQRKLARVTAWFESTGPAPKDWSICCSRLATQLGEMIQALTEAIIKSTETDEDRIIFKTEIIANISNTWQVYEFDELVGAAGAELGLTGFDAVAFRNTRQDQWQKLSKLFITRGDAKAALERAIKAELTHLFGDLQKV